MPYIGFKLSLEAFEALRKCSKERNISYLYSEPQKCPLKSVDHVVRPPLLLRWVYFGGYE